MPAAQIEKQRREAMNEKLNIVLIHGGFPYVTLFAVDATFAYGLSEEIKAIGAGTCVP
jgi:hypothetical protein